MSQVFLHSCIKYFRCIAVYKALNNLTPLYLTNLIKPFKSIHHINTRGSLNQHTQLPKANNNAGKRTFAFLAAKDWNTLDVGMRNAPCLSAFRGRYLKKAFSDMCNVLSVC